jgi:hypothetical protein
MVDKSAVKLMIGRQAKMTIPYQSAYRIIMVRASISAQAKDAGMGLSFGAGAGPPSGAGIPSSIAVAALMPRWRAKRKQSVNSMRSRAR